MPKVYILPELIVHDYDVPKTFYPYTAKKYKQISGDGSNSLHDYTLYMDGVEIPKKRYVPSMGGEIWHYGKSSWGLFSIEAEPGEHTITIDAMQESFYSIDDLGIKIGDRPRAIRFYEPFKRTNNKFKKEITFNTIDENVFLHFILEFEQYYPVVYCVNGSVYAPSNNIKTDGRYVWWCDKNFRYSINTKFSFQQINYGTMKGLMDVVMKREFANAYNEPMPEPSEEDIRSTRSVKSSTGNSSTVQTKPNGAQSVKVEQKINNVNNLPNSNIQAQSSNNSSTIQANKKVEKPEIKTIVKEVEKRVPYYETKEFKDLMKDYDYEIVGTQVAIKKVLSAKKEMVIPDGVTLIKENAFGKDLSNVLSVTIPYSVTTIEKGAFLSNTYVQKVVLNANITTIKEDTFKCCTSLKDITLSPTIEHIEKGAFSGVRVDNIFLPYGAKYDKDSFDKGVNVVYGNKKTLEIQKQVQKEIEKENSINVREEITAIKEQKFDRDEIIKRYDNEIAQIENSYESELEKYKAELERFDLTYLGKEKEVQSLISDYDKVKDEISKNTALSIEYDRKFKKLLKDFAKAYDIDLKKKYPDRF